MLNTLYERIKPQDDTVVGTILLLLESDVLFLLASLPAIVICFYGVYTRKHKLHLATKFLLVTKSDYRKSEDNRIDLERQKNMISTMGKVIECRSGETGDHVQRVASMSFYVAQLYGLPDSDCEILRVISPMHDIGKIAVSDAILNKPGKLNKEEFELMKRHTTDGYQMLSSSPSPLMKLAAIVAHEHHEKWDGTGYPNGKAGQQIHIYGRITAIVDVVDALLSSRPYKQPWPISRVKAFLIEQSGKHFEPKLAELVVDNFSTVIAVRNATNEDIQVNNYPKPRAVGVSLKADKTVHA